jgi:tRNA uridine 5-carboxymethylaminomethyl modification enzyme
VWPDLEKWDPLIAQQAEIEAKYQVYLSRQQADIEAYKRDRALVIPVALDYAKVGSLSSEARESLEAARPESLAGAARLPGVTPAAVTALMVHLRRSGRPAL